MKKKELFINRELSWLEFNQRVLELAQDTTIPLLERLKFLSITASNLDEFFMVRVGGLQMLISQKIIKRDAAGLTPEQQIDRIGQRIRKMTADQQHCFTESIVPGLFMADIKRILPQELDKSQQEHCSNVFINELFPLLTPIAVSVKRPFPLLKNGVLHFLVRLKSAAATAPSGFFAVVPVNESFNRFVSLPTREKGYRFILIDDLVGMYLEQLFPGETIMERVLFRITRNADMSVQEDLAFDLLSQMEALLDARKRSDCVRLEIDLLATKATVQYLKNSLKAPDDLVFTIPGVHNFASWMPLCSLEGYDHLRYEHWTPVKSHKYSSGKSMFSLIAQNPVTLYHPYESFEPVIQLINEAADDPDVLAIKQILYRTSKNSPIVEALKRAALNGKAVTALVELKARFDEARNIQWANQLEDAGVQVIYGIKNLKTHAKLCIIVRREAQGIKRYCHFGTGNYNERTAALYCDISYMTVDDDLGSDASSFFNAITGFSSLQKYKKIEAAPIGLKTRLLELIEGELERKKQGQQTHIMLKANSLTDADIIQALYKASKAGVPIDLNIRGICMLRPGLPGVSETITVKSIIDRYLEHSRIYSFHHGGDQKVFISSADLMLRNLQKRIELLTPIDDAVNKKRILHFLKSHLAENVNGWVLRPDGRYERTSAPEQKKNRVRSQRDIYFEISDAEETYKRNQPTVFEPHRAPSSQ